MSAQLPPMHPYNVMLFRISVFLKTDMGTVFALGRIMGCRELQSVTNPWMLFDKLEDMGCLSEFKVVDLKNALDLIGLSEAGNIVREYEDKELKGKSEASTGDCRPSESSSSETATTQPSPPPYSFIKPLDDSHMPGQENESSQVSETIKPLSSHEGTNDRDTPNTPMDTEKPQVTRPRFKPKYHTVAAPSVEKKERKTFLNGMEQKTKEGN